MQSFEALGREIDQATQQATAVQVYLKNLGSPKALGKALTIAIQGANATNGALGLQKYLRAVIEERLGELVGEAASRMIGDAEKRRREFLDALTRSPEPEFDTASAKPPPQQTGKANGSQTRNATAR